MIRPQNVKDSLPQTLAQKIIARAAGKAEVEVGEIEIGSVDLAMIHDSGGPRRVAPILERLGVEVWDPEKLVVVTDHYVPVFDSESRAILDLARDWVKKQGVARFHDEEGICHVVLTENGYLKPGIFAVSFAGIFQRNAFNLGLLVLECEERDKIREGDLILPDPKKGMVLNQTTGEQLSFKKVPEFLLQMLGDGGLVPHLVKKLKQGNG